MKRLRVVLVDDKNAHTVCEVFWHSLRKVNFRYMVD